MTITIGATAIHAAAGVLALAIVVSGSVLIARSISRWLERGDRERPLTPAEEMRWREVKRSFYREDGSR